MPRLVTCLECEVTWDPADNGVLYRSADNRWWCADYRACQARQAARAALKGPRP
jgi:hypothetical protein